MSAPRSEQRMGDVRSDGDNWIQREIYEAGEHSDTHQQRRL